MIVSVTRHPVDIAAIQCSGVRATVAPTFDAGVTVAAHSAARLVICDLPGTASIDGRFISVLGQRALPCPVLLRHDITPESIDALYDVALLDSDIRPSFREYDDLTARLRLESDASGTQGTSIILRSLGPRVAGRLREFAGVMAILGERPTMQRTVASALGLSSSSFRQWLAEQRHDSPDLPRFPAINAAFVALHFTWRRERLRWTAKRCAAAAGFTDEKAGTNYLRYHWGRSAFATGAFDALMTRTVKMFSARAALDPAREFIRRI